MCEPCACRHIAVGSETHPACVWPSLGEAVPLRGCPGVGGPLPEPPASPAPRGLCLPPPALGSEQHVPDEQRFSGLPRLTQGSGPRVPQRAAQKRRGLGGSGAGAPALGISASPCGLFQRLRQLVQSSLGGLSGCGGAGWALRAPRPGWPVLALPGGGGGGSCGGLLWGAPPPPGPHLARKAS